MNPCLHVLVGAAVQWFDGETREEVVGNSWQERTKAAAEPQLDEGGIVEEGFVDDMQPEFSYGVQDHGGRRMFRTERLQQEMIHGKLWAKWKILIGDQRKQNDEFMWFDKELVLGVFTYIHLLYCTF